MSNPEPKYSPESKDSLDQVFDRSSELGLELDRDTQKFDYFLIGLSTSAIGFSIHASRDSLFGWSLIILGCALLFWGLTITLGITKIHRSLKSLRNTFHRLSLIRLAVSAAESDSLEEEKRKSALSKVAEILPNEALKAIKSFDPDHKLSERAMFWQLLFFFVGVFFFVLWHFCEIYLRTYQST